MDICGAVLALVIFSPVMILTALLVKLTSKGPIIFKQERIGLAARPFCIYKFRSMCNGAESMQKELLRFNEATGPVFKMRNDPRVTPSGRFIRRWSRDELPQFWNVLKGDMSLVGPRPYMPYEVDVYKPLHFRRLEVLPGMTGIGQISGRSRLTFQEVVNFDLEYIERRSLLLDLQILLKTLPVVFSGRGAR